MYKLSISGKASSKWALLVNSADNKFVVVFFFIINKKTGFDISCNGDNLCEMQIMFSWKNEKNISKCRLLKILPGVLRVKVCTDKLCMSLCMAKPLIKLVRRDGSEPAHQSSDQTCKKRQISVHTLS